MKFPWTKKTVQPAARVHVGETKAVLGLNDSLAQLLLFGYKDGGSATSALQLYNDSSAVSIPINKVADPFSALEPVLRTGDDIERDHPLLDLIRNPSPYYTQGLFLEMIGKDYLITNESHIVAIGAINRPPLELQPISPGNVNINEGAGGVPGTIQISGTTLTGSYAPDNRKRQVRYFNGGLRELYYIRGYSTKHNSLLRGQSLLLSASNEVRQHVLGGRHNVSLLEKGGRVSLAFHFEEDLDPDNFQATVQAINDKYAGAENAGTIGVTSGGKMSVEQLGTSNLDMDFAELQKQAKIAVALQYKVPLPLITVDSQTFNNYANANLALYDDAVLPLADRIFEGLSYFLLPRYGIDPAKTQITYDIDRITALAVRRNEELKLRKDLGAESINEIRGAMGKEPAEGADSIYIPANLIPIGRDIYTEDQPKVVRDDE